MAVRLNKRTRKKMGTRVQAKINEGLHRHITIKRIISLKQDRRRASGKRMKGMFI